MLTRLVNEVISYKEKYSHSTVYIAPLIVTIVTKRAGLSLAADLVMTCYQAL